MSVWIWAVAAAAYAAFLAWYVNWKPPLRAEEIDSFLERIRGTPSGEHNDLEVLRDFLAADDGREFLMLNLVRLTPGAMTHPVTGAATDGARLLQEYTRSFMPALVRRGGHPALVGRKIGGYVDAWKVPADPGWHVVGCMRYRSRRDLIALVGDARFLGAHPLKIAATAETFSFPTRPMLRLYPSPPVWMALAIALAAALSQIAMLVS